jgi:hypothetical protein
MSRIGAFRVALISYLLVSLLVYLFVTYWIRRTLRKVIRMKMTRIDHYSYLATYWPSLIVRLILKFKPRSFRSPTIVEEHKHNHTRPSLRSTNTTTPTNDTSPSPPPSFSSPPLPLLVATAAAAVQLHPFFPPSSSNPSPFQDHLSKI